MTKLTAAELAAESVELLPGRETLNTFNFPISIDTNITNITANNLALAFNNGGDDSSANAWATQVIEVVNYNE